MTTPQNPTAFSFLDPGPPPAQDLKHRKMTQEEKMMRTFDHLTTHVDRFNIKDGYQSPAASSIKSSKSLHDLGLENYPYPDLPEEKRLTRKGEKQSLQNLNNRLAGYIDKVFLL